LNFKNIFIPSLRNLAIHLGSTVNIALFK